MTDYFLKIKISNSDLFCAYKQHAEASEYQGCEYLYRGDKYIQRIAKVTPKKTGQFVTLWKRNLEGITTPFDASDDFQFVVIIAQKDQHLGHFLFPKDVLIEKGILTSLNEGKRGFRVYPSWDMPKNKQASQTQKWQLEYFSPNLILA